MLRRIIELALSQRMLMLVLAALLLGAGGYAFSRLPIDAYPDISTTQVKLILKAPGMTPEEVEQRVIAPLELELLGIPNQVVLRSMAKYAIADITIDFTDATDVYWARQQVGERLAQAMDELPDTVSGGLAPIATPLSEIFMFTIEGGTLSLAERRTLLDWTIRPALRTISGVADVNALGGHVASFEVVPDEETHFSLFKPAAWAVKTPAQTPEPTPESTARPALAIRIAPNEDVCSALESICREHGIQHASVRGGVGSTVGAWFDDGRRVEAFVTETLVRHGRVHPGPDGQPLAEIDVSMVDHLGGQASGRLMRGANPVLVTFELVLEPA